MNDVGKDLEALANLELPQKPNKAGKNIVKVTIMCFAITILASLTTVTYALITSRNRENGLQNEVTCVRASSVLLDRRLGEGLSVIIDNNGIVLTALGELIQKTPEQFEAALAQIRDQIAAGEVAKSNLDDAIEARETTLTEC